MFTRAAFIDRTIAFLKPFIGSLLSSPTGATGLLTEAALDAGDGCGGEAGVRLGTDDGGACRGTGSGIEVLPLVPLNDSICRSMSSFKMRPSRPVPLTSRKLIYFLKSSIKTVVIYAVQITFI